MRLVIVVFLLLGGAIPAHSQSFLAKVTAHSVCSYGKEFRSVRVQEQGTHQCDTIYTKKGTDRRIGGGSFVKTCLRIYKNVVKNLEEGSWSCRSAQGSQFTVETTGG